MRWAIVWGIAAFSALSACKAGDSDTTGDSGEGGPRSGLSITGTPHDGEYLSCGIVVDEYVAMRCLDLPDCPGCSLSWQVHPQTGTEHCEDDNIVNITVNDAAWVDGADQPYAYGAYCQDTPCPAAAWGSCSITTGAYEGLGGAGDYRGSWEGEASGHLKARDSLGAESELDMGFSGAFVDENPA